MNNILTFDIEEWFHANYDDKGAPKPGETSNFKNNMEKLLALCKKNNCKATFFILGYIGENYPDVVRAIANEGHEIASHGYSHDLAYHQTIDEFRADVMTSVAILEGITGKKIKGYRAPSWSIVEKNIHYLEVLEDLGFLYDASIFPVKTFLYGIPTAPKHIHHPMVDGRRLKLFEVPTSVFNFMGRGLGYSGGFYFRFFPEFFIKSVIRETNVKKAPSVVYLHPREIDGKEKRLNLPPKESFIHYYNINGTLRKLDNIMGEFDFTSIERYLSQHHTDERLKGDGD